MTARGAGERVSLADVAPFEEHARDMEESPFTPILRRCASSVPGALAVSFFDAEGETVDYCSTLPPFDAKVMGASIRVLREQITRDWMGPIGAITIQADELAFVVHHVGEGYDVALVARSTFGEVPPLACEALAFAAHELRIEAEIPHEAWDAEHLAVEVRASRAWGYAPSAFVEGNRRRAVTNVLGRWMEDTADGVRIVCFRVRSDEGEEVTLGHDVESGRWDRR